MNLSALRRTAAEIAAAAVYEMFPDVELLGGGETPTGFSYSLRFPHPINPDTLSLIEERMRQIVREKRPIRTLEMVPFSASELLKRDGHRFRAEELEGLEGLVDVIQIGSFHDLSEGPHLKNTAEAAAFKLLSIDSPSPGEILLTGSAHFSKEQLKEFLKKIAAYKDPEKIGEERGLWLRLDEGVVWLEKGLELKKKLSDFWQKKLFSNALPISGPEKIENSVARRLKRLPLQIFNAGREPLQINSYFPGDQIESAIISSLQLVDEILKILGFSYRLYWAKRKKGSKVARALEKLKWEAETETQERHEMGALGIQFRIEDEIGRNWTVVQMREIKESSLEGFLVAISVEKILSLLIEKKLDIRLNQV